MLSHGHLDFLRILRLFFLFWEGNLLSIFCEFWYEDIKTVKFMNNEKIWYQEIVNYNSRELPAIRNKIMDTCYIYSLWLT